MRHTSHLSFRWLLGLAAISIVALALVPLASARIRPHTRAAVKTIRVTAKEFSYQFSSKSIARPGKVRFTVKNAGRMVHNFRIDGRQTRLIKPGETARLVVTFKKKGTYRYVCTVPGHAAAGMKGVMRVR